MLRMRKSVIKKGIGILYILGAALCFACMNLFVSLAGDLPLMQKVFFRNALTVVVVFVMLRKIFHVISPPTFYSTTLIRYTLFSIGGVLGSHGIFALHLIL